MKTLVVIPVINLWKEYTKPCIQSLEGQDILLIDNNSTDETEKEAPKFVKYYQRNEFNWGVQKSWNYGINFGLKKGYKYIFVINNDTLFKKDTISLLEARMDKGDVIMVTAHNVRAEVTPDKLNEVQKPESESEGADFAAFMVDKRLFEKVGEFDEGFYPAYFEDNSMHYKIKLINEKAINYQPAVYYHFGSRTQNQKPNGLVNGQMFITNRNYYIKMWGGEPGKERFKHPFNDKSKTIKWTQQSKS